MDPNRWRPELARMEAALRPIANRPVDLSDPDWQAKLARSNPLDEADVRGESGALLLDILRGYAGAAEAERPAIRALVTEFPSFFWAAQVPDDGAPSARLRSRLLHFALLDQGRDPRDAVLHLDDLCRAPGVAAGELVALRREISEMASDADRYGFGSTRSMLLSGYGQYGATAAPEPRRPG